jgi:TNF receptor-associated factor 4
MIDPQLVESGCDENLTCGICTLVLRVPSSGCPQGHTFCKGCYRSQLRERQTCPTCRHPTAVASLVRNRPVENMVLALRVSCTHSEIKDRPCSWKGKLADLETHLSTECPNEPVACPNAGCIVCLPRRLVATHARSECTRRPLPCRYCGLDVAKTELGAHEAGCLQAPVACPHGCGAQLLKRQAVAHDQTCPLAPAACPCLGCGCVVPRRDLPAHLATFAVEHARAVASELGELKATNQEQRALLERLTRTVQEQHATIEGAPPPQHCPHEPKPTLPAR